MSTSLRKIIDTCCLLDLYAGWNGLDPLEQFDSEWYVCPATLNEARFIRDVDAEENLVKVPIDLVPALEQKLIIRADTTDEEFDSFLQFAGELDDGEAMSLAIAMHRGWVLATDDNKATKMAAASGVETTSTPEAIKDWAELDKSNLANLKAVLQAIEERARFKPSRRSHLYDWWIENSRG